MEPAPWQVVAFNPSKASENKIHDDTVARRYGYRGGLVPGVCVYAYLVHPAVEAWGLAWLERGSAAIDLRRPVYEGEKVTVAPEPDGARRYAGRVANPEGEECARGEVALPDAPGAAPRPRGDPPAPAPEARPPATRATLERLREEGLGAVAARWTGAPGDAGYTRSAHELPALLRPDGGGYASPAFALGLANRALSANVRLGPWIHGASEARSFAAIPRGSALRIESRVVDLSERRGHEWVDLDVAVFLEPDTPALAVRHRAIYRLREPA